MTAEAGILIDTYPIPTLGMETWENRLEFIVEELALEHGDHFYFSDHTQSRVDILFLFYQVSQHDWMSSDLIFKSILTNIIHRPSSVNIIACGIDSKKSLISAEAIEQVVAAQCTPIGIQATATRAVRPEDIDENAHKLLIKKHSRFMPGLRLQSATLHADDQDNGLKTGYGITSYESSDL